MFWRKRIETESDWSTFRADFGQGYKQTLRDFVQDISDQRIRKFFDAQSKKKKVQAIKYMEEASKYLVEQDYSPIYGTSCATWNKPCGCQAYYDPRPMLFDSVHMSFCSEHHPVNKGSFPYSYTT